MFNEGNYESPLRKNCFFEPNQRRTDKNTQ